jgi:D-aminoacyl-tRNA deacylase
MHIAIIVSKLDPAGLNIKEHLLKSARFEESGQYEGNIVYELNDAKLYTVNKESIHNEDIDKKISADLFIFATKHQSASGIHSLSVHAPGNWDEAEYGGATRKLCVAPASYLKEALQRLEKLAEGMHYEIIQECTHHGPYLGKPCFFIEIGSSNLEWINPEAGKVIAKVILDLIENPPKQYEAIFGIGGLHHTPNFKKIVIDSEYALGHVCPKYMIECLDKQMILQAIEKTQEKIKFAVLDWKGLAGEKESTVQMLNELKLDWKKTKDF